MTVNINPRVIRDSSLVVDMDPANEQAFRGPITTNINTDGNLFIYNNQGANITTTLTKTTNTYRGAPIWVSTYTPVNQSGASQFSGGQNGGVGVYVDFSIPGGGGLANRYTGHSIFFRANKPLYSVPIINFYSNVVGYLPQYNFAFDDMGDGWYRAYTIWYDTVTRSDAKFWAPNPAQLAVNETITFEWAGPFKEDRNDSSYVSPYCNGTRGSTVALNGGVFDNSGRDNNGELNGDIRYNTANRGSWSWSGNTANYIRIPDADSLSFLGNTFTLDIWINASPATNSWGVLGKRNPWEYSVFADGSGSIIFDSWNVGGNGVYYHNPPIISNQWVHYCQVANGVTSNLYINGVLNSTSTKSANTMGNGSSPLDIGTGGRGDGLRPMNGQIGPIKIYNRALTQAEVIQNFNAIRGRYSI